MRLELRICAICLPVSLYSCLAAWVVLLVIFVANVVTQLFQETFGGKE